MRSAILFSATVALVSLAQALPTEIKRTPAPGLLDSISAPLGMDSNMANAIPGKDIPSSLGLEKVVSGLGLKRGLAGLDDLMGMTGLRNSPLGPAVTEQPGDVMPVISSFVPLDMTGSPIAPGGRPEIGGQKAVEDLPVVGEMTGGIPLEPLEGLLGSIGAGGLVKRREKRSRMAQQWSGAEELNDFNDAPHWG